MAHGGHVEDARRSREEELRDREPCAEAQRARVVRRLERPDPPRQPVEKRKAVRVIAKDRLAEMRMALDEPGDDELAGAVEQVGAAGRAQPPPDPRDPSVRDEQVGAEHAPGRIHGDEGAVLEEQCAPAWQHAPRK